MTAYIVLKDLHKDLGGHKAGDEVRFGPGMAHSLVSGGYIARVGSSTAKLLETKPAPAKALQTKAAPQKGR